MLHLDVLNKAITVLDLHFFTDVLNHALAPISDVFLYWDFHQIRGEFLIFVRNFIVF
jgi:hypothetical protein